MSDAASLARDLAGWVVSGDVAQWRKGRAVLEGLDGSGWLRLDDAARSFEDITLIAVYGSGAWRRAPLDEPSGVVAAVASLHVDGRIRQRAARALGYGVDGVRAAALAVRMLDHVRGVREEAAAGLLPRLDVSCAEPVLGVLLAGRGRRPAPAALEQVWAALQNSAPVADVLARLRSGEQRNVRRWAFERSDLTIDQLMAAVHTELDQQVRTSCARRLAAAAGPAELRALLHTTSADARMAAVTRLPDADLADADLWPLLGDRAARIRSAVRDRARRRGLDVAGWYRTRLDGGGPPGRVAACLDGLAAAGDATDVDRFAGALGDPSPRVRAAAASGLVTDRARALDMLPPLLLDPSPRVTSTAARLLGRIGSGPAAADAAWASPQVWSRRAAWQLTRTTGSWNRVEADLRVAQDGDAQLAALGRGGFRTWLASESARTWAPLDPAQRERIGRLLDDADLDERTHRVAAFHIGTDLPERDDSDPPRRSLQATAHRTPGGTMNDTASTDIWPAVHVERTALADDLADLTDAQWATRSLCGEWTVREVLAHLTSAATLRPLSWMWSVLRSRFDFDRHNADRLAEQLGTTPAETLTRFRAIATSQTSTLGPKAAWLGEVIVHAEDIRRPLGIRHDYPIDVVTRLAEFFVKADFTVPSKTLTKGLRLEATDGPFTAGTGPLVSGPTLALTMAMAGRATFGDDLTGAGVPTLRERARAAGSI